MKFEKTIKRVKERKAGVMITIMFLLLMPFSSSAQDFSRVCHKSVTHPFFCVFLYILVES